MTIENNWPPPHFLPTVSDRGEPQSRIFSEATLRTNPCYVMRIWVQQGVTTSKNTSYAYSQAFRD